MSAHAVLSPSSAHRWLTCPGSVRLCAGHPDVQSDASAEGTRAHEIAAALLMGDACDFGDFNADDTNAIREYVEFVRSFYDVGALLVEQRLPIEFLTGEKHATGTADVVQMHGQTLRVIDLKFGYSPVYAENNPQLMMYAAAALEEFGAFWDVREIEMVIHQPRIGNVSFFKMPVADLVVWSKSVRDAAQITRMADAPLVPSDSACKYCKVKAFCPALQKLAEETQTELFEVLAPPADDLTRMGALLKKRELIEGFFGSLALHVENALQNGLDVPGWKLVMGRKGDRKWGDEAEVEAAARKMRIKDFFVEKIITPAAAEKLAKSGAIGPRQWPQFEKMMAQSEARPKLAPAGDRRAAVKPESLFDE